MAKLPSYETKTKNELVVAALIISVVFTNVFVILSPDESVRSHNARLTSTVTIGVAPIICLIRVNRYKRRLQVNASIQLNTKQSAFYYDNNSPTVLVIPACRQAGRASVQLLST